MKLAGDWSDDGRYFAYVGSHADTRLDGAQWQWTRSSAELAFLRADGHLMSATADAMHPGMRVGGGRQLA